MSKYLFPVLIGSDAAFPLHLSRLQLEAAAVTPHAHIPDTLSSPTRPNANRQGGGKGRSRPPPPRTSSLTPHLFLNEAVTVVHMNLRQESGLPGVAAPRSTRPGGRRHRSVQAAMPHARCHGRGRPATGRSPPTLGRSSGPHALRGCDGD